MRKLGEGDRVGPYLISKFLAAGGSGEVFVARDDANGTDVALKILSKFSPVAAVRFAREVSVLRRLDHPGVARIVADAQIDGLTYFAMELLSGETLEQRLERGRMDPAVAIDIAAQIAATLWYAHSLGVIHRDIKPGNVFLCEGSAPNVKVLDFGVAHCRGDRKLTVTGNPIGTWSYMPPEQVTGASDGDARADIWSLGVVLFEMLAGALPFASTTVPGFIYKVLSEAAPPLRSLAPDVPDALCTLVDAMLQKQREARPADMDAVKHALESARG
jgi:serine/threonine protein kinase